VDIFSLTISILSLSVQKAIYSARASIDDIN
jgi:hypothetical protein